MRHASASLVLALALTAASGAARADLLPYPHPRQPTWSCTEPADTVERAWLEKTKDGLVLKATSRSIGALRFAYRGVQQISQGRTAGVFYVLACRDASVGPERAPLITSETRLPSDPKAPRWIEVRSLTNSMVLDRDEAGR